MTFLTVYAGPRMSPALSLDIMEAKHNALTGF
jgi:hypothetical protein